MTDEVRQVDILNAKSRAKKEAWLDVLGKLDEVIQPALSLQQLSQLLELSVKSIQNYYKELYWKSEEKTAKEERKETPTYPFIPKNPYYDDNFLRKTQFWPPPSAPSNNFYGRNQEKIFPLPSIGKQEEIKENVQESSQETKESNEQDRLKALD